MNPAKKLFQHAELFITETGQILAHNITPEMAAVLSELNPGDNQISERVQRASGASPEVPKPNSQRDAGSTLI